jgi:Putative sensor
MTAGPPVLDDRTMTTTITPFVVAAPARRRGMLRRWYRPLAEPRTWKETASLLVALPVGTVWFSLVVSGLALSAGLLVTLVGLPLLVALVYGGRLIGAAERSMARALLDMDLPSPPPVDRTGSPWRRGRRLLRDGPGWRGLAYGILALPVGIVTFVIAALTWTVAAALAAFPVYGLFISGADLDDVPDVLDPFLHGWGRVGSTIGIAVVGVLMLALVPRIVHRLADLRSRFVCRWLNR